MPRLQSYRNQSTDLQSTSIDWFLQDSDFNYDRNWYKMGFNELIISENSLKTFYININRLFHMISLLLDNPYQNNAS